MNNIGYFGINPHTQYSFLPQGMIGQAYGTSNLPAITESSVSPQIIWGDLVNRNNSTLPVPFQASPSFAPQGVWVA